MLKYRALALLFALPTMATGQARAAEETSPATPSITPGTMVIDAQQLEVFVDKQMRAVGAGAGKFPANHETLSAANFSRVELVIRKITRRSARCL